MEVLEAVFEFIASTVLYKYIYILRQRQIIFLRSILNKISRLIRLIGLFEASLVCAILNKLRVEILGFRNNYCCSLYYV